MTELGRQYRTFFNVHDDTWTALALWSILCYTGLLESINKITAFLIDKEVVWDTVITSIVLLICIIIGTAAAIKKLQRREFILAITIVLLWILSFFINEDSRQIMQVYYFKPVLFEAVCGIICIASFTNWERFKEVGKWFICLGTSLFIVLMLLCITGNISVGYMATSYNSLVFVIGSFWLAIHKKNLLYWFLSILGSVMMTIAGCRGGLVCIAVYVTAEIFFNSKIKTLPKVLFFLAIVLLLFNVENIMHGIESILNKYDYESRTISMFFEGTLKDDSGRSQYSKGAFEVIKEHPIFGCGMGGSSHYLYEKVKGFTPVGLQRSYSHNLFLDILMDYGVFFGAIIIIILLIGFVNAYRKGKKNRNIETYFMLFSLAIPKLMLSSTYVAESTFFILLGLMINFIFLKYEDEHLLAEVEK